MKRLLLTGAEGFTGRHFCKAAVAAGFDVYPLTLDLVDAIGMAAEVARIKPTYVVHLAAISSVGHPDQENFYRTNVIGTMNLLNALSAVSEQVKKILLASSANVYGNYDGGFVAESVCPRPVNHYAMSKLAMEYMAATYSDRLPIVITRPFNYTGVGQDLRFVVPKIVDHFARQVPVIELGALDVKREYNDVRMVCDACLLLLEKGTPGETYNVCSGQEISVAQVISELIGLSDFSPEIRVNPKFVRPNEIKALVGDNRKLVKCIGAFPNSELKILLEWMYKESVKAYG